MKSLYVSSLQDGQAVTSLFLVREKEIRTSPRTGSSWLQLELCDRTGTISAKMWENFTPIVSTFERDDVVQIRGRVKLYNGQKELTLEAVIPSRRTGLRNSRLPASHKVRRGDALLRSCAPPSRR